MSSSEITPGKIIAISSERQFDKIIEKGGSARGRLVIVKFGAGWCEPCVKIHPHLERLCKTYSKHCVFLQVDVDEHKNTQLTAGIRHIPTFRVYLKGEQREEIASSSPDEIERIIKKYQSAVHLVAQSWDEIADSGSGRTLASPSSHNTCENPELLSALLEFGIEEPIARKAAAQCASSDNLTKAVEVAFQMAAQQTTNASISMSDDQPSAPSLSNMDDTQRKALIERQEKKLQKKIQKIKAHRQAEAQRRAEQAEIARIQSGKSAQELREQLSAEQAMRDVDYAKREKQREREYRKSVEAKIRREQVARRLAKKQKSSGAGSTSTTTTTTTSVMPTHKVDVKKHPDCKLQIRLPTGKRLVHTFRSTDTIATVIEWIEQQNVLTSPLFYLQTPVPVEQFKGDKIYTPLSDTGLPPRGVLVLKQQNLTND